MGNVQMLATKTVMRTCEILAILRYAQMQVVDSSDCTYKTFFGTIIRARPCMHNLAHAETRMYERLKAYNLQIIHALP